MRVERALRRNLRCQGLSPDRPHRFSTELSIWGPTLDVSQLVTRGEPSGDYDLWRLGEPNDTGVGEGRNLTSGFKMSVYCGWSEDALNESVLAFVDRERRLLAVARSLVGATDHYDLTTSIRLTSREQHPIGVGIPPRLLDRLAEVGATWTVSVWSESMFEAESG